MEQDYYGGLTATDNTILKKERRLAKKDKKKKKKGDKVKSEDIVAETLLPGKVVPYNLANKLGITPEMIKKYIKIKEGDEISKGQLIAETNGIFGLFKSRVKSPIDGEVENISSITGQLLLREPRIPIQLDAFIDGIVVEVMEEEGVIVENKSAYIQGIFGLGGETVGELKIVAETPDQVINPEKIDESCKDKIVVCGCIATYQVIKKAQKMGVKALISGGIDDNDIKKILGYDIGVAITGHEDIGLTIVVTEGFGEIKMASKTFELLKKYEGHKTSAHGKTQIRAGVMRPEVIIPQKFDEKTLKETKKKDSSLDIGSVIRVIREPNFGKIGKVTALPEELKKVESETLVRLLHAELEDGTKIKIPRANVEIIEE